MTPPAAGRDTAAADAQIPAGHPFAAHLRRAASTGPHRPWTPADGPLPSLYLSHGAPMLFEMADWMTQLHDWARALPAPRAVLIVSAHWESAPLSISSTRPAELVYDFGGFDPMYSRMRYDTPDAGWLARRVAGLMPDTEPLHEHRRRGLDHGAWVPLKIMYPGADVPVLQLSMPTHDSTRLLALGERLRPLREEGVLVVGSGHMTHGLPFLSASDWAGRTTPGMPYAHPTVEHFTPLFVSLGAAGDPAAPVTTTIDGYALGLAKRSFQAA